MGIVAYAGTVIRALGPRLGDMRVPVLAYMAVISAMVWLSVWVFERAAGSPPRYALPAALLFMVSDTLLAFNRFRGRFAGAQVAILGTYFAAQWLFALAIAAV